MLNADFTDRMIKFGYFFFHLQNSNANDEFPNCLVVIFVGALVHHSGEF